MTPSLFCFDHLHPPLQLTRSWRPRRAVAHRRDTSMDRRPTLRTSGQTAELLGILSERGRPTVWPAQNHRDWQTVRGRVAEAAQQGWGRENYSEREDCSQVRGCRVANYLRRGTGRSIQPQRYRRDPSGSNRRVVPICLRLAHGEATQTQAECRQYDYPNAGDAIPLIDWHAFTLTLRLF